NACPQDTRARPPLQFIATAVARRVLSELATGQAVQEVRQKVLVTKVLGLPELRLVSEHLRLALIALSLNRGVNWGDEAGAVCWPTFVPCRVVVVEANEIRIRLRQCHDGLVRAVPFGG